MSQASSVRRVTPRVLGVLLLALVVAVGAGLMVTSRAVQAQSSATGAGGQTLTVSAVSDLDPAGVKVSVTGSGYDMGKGIYVSFCVIPPPGTLPTPCGGGIDLTGSGGGTVWISSNPPIYATGLTTPYGLNGSFSVQLTVEAALDDTIDCRLVACAVVTRNDHTRSDDRSQDVIVPVTFRGTPPSPGITVSPTAIASEPASSPLRSGTPVGSGTPVDRAAGCGPSTALIDTAAIDPISPVPVPALPVTVRSEDGRDVTVTDVRRILPVNLYGSIAEIVFSLGLGANVVGRDIATTFDAAKDLPLVTTAGTDLSAEAILALNPSVILADDSIGPPEVLQQMRDSGIPVVMLPSLQTLDGISDHIRSIAAALGVPDAGNQLVARTEQQIAVATTSVVAPQTPLSIAFLYIRGSAGVYLITGSGAGPDAMIGSIGAVDAGAQLGIGGFKPITSEALIGAAPDVILILTDSLKSVGGIDGLLKLPGIAQTPAGEHRRIVDMDDGVLLNFGTRTGAAIKALAKAVYQPCG
ncbi:MAG: ABC transporter substrate-binding protein [Chloroflexi bacterium]|nr:ABC transporter substrate-binding protein [Chloroflexota bacterium]